MFIKKTWEKGQRVEAEDINRWEDGIFRVGQSLEDSNKKAEEDLTVAKEALSQAIGANSAKISEAKEEVSSVNQATVAIVNRVKVTEDNIGDIQTDLKSKSTSIDEIKQRVTRAEEVNSSQGNQLTDLNSRATAIEKELTPAGRKQQTLSHGIQVIDAEENAPLSISFEGNTLIPMQNTKLDSSKYYVLADKKTHLKWADGTMTNGMSKFTGKNERPSIVRVANLEGKVSGSTIDNPHVMKRTQYGTSGSANTLLEPSNVSNFLEADESILTRASNLDGITTSLNNTVNGNISQHLFSFNLIEEIERYVGRIPRTTLAEKVKWIKDNIAKTSANWYGYGVNPNGNKATFAKWESVNSSWDTSHSSITTSTVSKITIASSNNKYISSDGFMHFLAYTEPSDGITASTINTDYIELEIEFKPTVLLENFSNKVATSTEKNPHIAVTYSSSSLISSPTDENFSQNRYNDISTLNNSSTPTTTSTDGQIPQSLFSFNLIEAVKRKYKTIPGTTVDEQLVWLKDNVNLLTFNWHGYARGPNGNTANLKWWNSNSSVYNNTPNTHSSDTVQKLSFNFPLISNLVDSNGFVHFLAYAEASDGTTSSTINTDYVDLMIELHPTDLLHDPCIPLYEVDKSEYDKILVSYNEDEVLSRYPKAQGMQHLQGTYVIAEGSNLLKNFLEEPLISTTSGQIKVLSSYEIEIDASTGISNGYQVVDVFPNNNYSLDVISANGEIGVYSDESSPASIVSYKKNNLTFNSGKRNKVRVYFRCASGIKETFKNPMLTLGSVPKPFVPRNPSYLFADVKLGKIGDKKDILYQSDGKWLIQNEVVKDVVLDGSLNWVLGSNRDKYKAVQSNAGLGSYLINATNNIGKAIVNKYNMICLKEGGYADGIDKFQNNATGTFVINISNYDSGFADSYTPISNEIKAYFNGWKVKTSDTNGKPNTWQSVVDRSDAPTQTLAYVSANYAPSYTPYKLSYVLATPQIVDVSDKVEGALTVNGLTQIEVGSGVIVREKAKIYTGSTSALINDNRYDDLLKSKAEKIIAVYKNDKQDHSWIFETTFGYGKYFARLPLELYDSTAEYTVTYLVQDRHEHATNVNSTSVSWPSTLKSVVNDLVVNQSDNSTQISVLVRSMAEMYKRVVALGG